MLDLHTDEAVNIYDIAEISFRACTARGGTVAGEHGDGIVRGQRSNALGDELYDAFTKLKELFDPHGLMNPGKIIDAASLTDATLLRYGDHYQPANVATHYRFHEHHGLQLAVEQCNGVGACRKINAGTMCPSYMATRDEIHSTRGRANALRMGLSGQWNMSATDALADDRLHEALSLCLSRKACVNECPNGVDMAKLKPRPFSIVTKQKGHH